MGTIYTKEGWSIRYNGFWAFQVCSKTFYDFKMIFLQKKIFWGFRGRRPRSRSRFEVKIDRTASNGVPLEPSWPKEFKNVNRKIRNRFCPVLEPVFRIFTISKTPPIPAIKPSTIQFLHIKHWFAPCDMVRMSQETFLHRLYISYYISFRAVLIENHQFWYNEDPILVPFGPL